VFDAAGNPSGVVKSHANAVLNAAGDAFTGAFKFDVIAPNGSIVFSGSGTHAATRVLNLFRVVLAPVSRYRR